MRDFSFDAVSARAGVRAIAPLAAPGIPFGLVLGFLISDGGIDPLAGWSSSWIILAGSSQLVAMNLLAEGASAAVIIVSIALINSRHAMYSAALRPRVANFPRWFRVVGPYFLLDQVFAIADSQPDGVSDRSRLWHFLGSGVFIWTVWQIAVAVGVVLGDVLRESWSLNFTVALLFLGLMMLSIKDRPGIAAATVAAAVALAGNDLPQGSGLLLAIVIGVAAGGAFERSARGVSAGAR